MQQHVAAYVRIGGLPLPDSFHADPRGTLHLQFATGDTTAVDRWAAQLGLPAPQPTGWGRYVARSGPGAWFGWTVRIVCDVAPAESRLKFVEYGGTIEVHGPSPDPARPEAGPLLGVARYRPGACDYMVFLAHHRPFLLQQYEAVFHALATGQVPAEGRPA